MNTPGIETRHQDAGPSTPAAVLVLLPVYNGGHYLAEQVESILGQAGVHTVVLCRDDGSRDDSEQVLEGLSQRWPDRIERVRDSLGNLGASGNFSRLMDLALVFQMPAPFSGPVQYVALSDQDDVWHADKLRVCMTAIKRLERAHPGRPALIHSDLRVISDDGREIAPSMARYQGLRTAHSGLAAQALSNTVTGCTSLMNRQLLELGLPVPAEAIMHDWWLSMVASALGARTYLDQALIDYRQHERNAIGAKSKDENPREKRLLKRLAGFFDQRHRQIFDLNARQAGAFLRRYRKQLSIGQTMILRAITLLAWPIPPLQRSIYLVLRRL
ncbi:MAG: glycosyltransferase family 2 protein [Hydrogenophaga sp.]|nr:glycosyltransferase family 2 protein [Hydrogenophaga sp.]